MKFEVQVLMMAMGFVTLAGFCNREEAEAPRSYEPYRRLTAEQIVADVQQRPIDGRSEMCNCDRMNIISDYGYAMGEVLLSEQVNAHPGRVHLVRRLMRQLHDFCFDYLDAEHLRVGGNGHMVEHGDGIYVQYLMRAIVEDMPDAAVHRRYTRLALPRLRSFEWRLQGLKFADNGPRFAHYGPDPAFEEKLRLERLENFEALRKDMMKSWNALATTLAELPTPVANRIIAYLEWRVDQGLDTDYRDYFGPTAPLGGIK